MSSLAYTHPDTHPASMITGLEDVINNYGYSACVTGYGSSTGELSFEPKFAILYDGEFSGDACIGIKDTYGIHISIASGNSNISGGYSEYKYRTTMSSSSVSFGKTGYYVVIG